MTDEIAPGVPRYHCGKSVCEAVRGYVCSVCATHWQDRTPDQIAADRDCVIWQRWRENREALDRGRPAPHNLTPEETEIGRREDTRRPSTR